MKKIIGILCVFCVIAGTLSACKSEPVSVHNEISPHVLSPEQQSIVDLISSTEQEIMLFNYITEDIYKSVEFWVEVYEYGTLTNRPAGISTHADEAKPINGQIAIIINHHSGISWTFTTNENGTRSSHTSEPLNMDYYDVLARGYDPIDLPVEILSGKEIVLYTSIYSEGDISSFSDKQRYVDEPELIQDYPLVHIIKCKFE